MPMSLRTAVSSLLAMALGAAATVPALAASAPARKASSPPNPPLYAPSAYRGSKNLAHFVGLAKAHPRNLTDQFEAGVAAFQNGMPQASIGYYKACLRIDPRFGQAANDIGNVYVELLKRPAEAIPYYKEAIHLTPGYLVAYLQLANAYIDLAKPALAVRAYEAALKVSPSFALADYDIAEEYQTALKKPSLAIVYYERTIHLDRLFDSAWLGLAQTYEQMGNRAKMRATAQAALKALPKNDPLVPYLKKLAK